MRSRPLLGAVLATPIVLLSVPAVPAARPSSGVPTFSRDVAPIFYKHCTTCHRPGEIAPMSLLTYADARPHADEIFDKVSEGHMPPWHADAPEGTFENERRLTAAERKTILDWAGNGAPRGDDKDLPPMPTYADGWAIGTPDVVFEMPHPFKVPANGTVAYQYFDIPTNFTDGKYVQAIEARPGNREVVHHVLVYYLSKPDAARTPVLRAKPEWSKLPDPSPAENMPQRPQGMTARLIGTYAPGTRPQIFRPGTALRLEPGGIIELQMHYTASGEAAADRTRIGLVFSKEPTPREIRAGSFINTTLVLPAGSANTAVPSEAEFQQDTLVYGLLPHTHLRGKRWEYKLVMPDGTERPILSVPKYDFNWQTYYMFKEPLSVPRGARIVATAWYDNSPGNKHNPDASVDVHWGDQTWEEMQYTGILFSPVAQPRPGSRH